MEFQKRQYFKMNPARLLTLILFSFIVLGTVLLKLPIAVEQEISWVDAFFTTVSALTVTGLVVVDTGSTFTTFGEVVILLLIQIGGIGIMTFTVLIFLMVGKRIGVKERMLIQQSLNHMSIGGVVALAKKILIVSLIIEAVAFCALSVRWVPEYGWKEGMYVAVFHSISAFNNAGFSIWSDSLSKYVADPIVNLIISLLIILGGLGFTVLIDLWEKKEFRQLKLHTKLMLFGTIFLNLFSMVVIFVLEYQNTLGNLSWFGKLQASFFQGIVPRTAGFNSVDIGSLNESTLFFIMILMFIGAGSTSTGGGIKLTTFLAITIFVFAFLKNRKEVVLFRKSISDTIVFRALAIAIVSLGVITLSTFLLSITEQGHFLATLFEVVSAFGTVGLSMGITSQLSLFGKMVIAIVMFIGKIGPLTLAYSMTKPDNVVIRYPKEDILTG
jgi:trk system potassium uptake protein